MSPIRVFVILLGTLGVFIVPQLSMAGPRVVGNGGDASVIRRIVLAQRREQIRSQLREVFQGAYIEQLQSDLYKFLGSELKLSDDGLEDKTELPTTILRTMKARGLAQEIERLNFDLRSECLDQAGLKRTATSQANVMGSSICIDLDRFIDGFGPYIQDSDIIALVMHELTHHFGFEDKNHHFAASIAQAWQSHAEQKSFSGEVTNFFVK